MLSLTRNNGENVELLLVLGVKLPRLLVGIKVGPGEHFDACDLPST